MDADFEVELGRDDPALEMPWNSESSRYYDLKHQPDMLLYVDEARRYTEMREALLRLNSSTTRLETAKCDVWFSEELSQEENVYGATCKFASYVDVLLSDPVQRLSFEQYECYVRDLTKLLAKAPEMPATADFVVRRCYFRHNGEQSYVGYYVTCYTSGYGVDENECRMRWGIALKLVVNALVQVASTLPPPRVQ